MASSEPTPKLHSQSKAIVLLSNNQELSQQLWLLAESEHVLGYHQDGSNNTYRDKFSSYKRVFSPDLLESLFTTQI